MGIYTLFSLSIKFNLGAKNGIRYQNKFFRILLRRKKTKIIISLGLTECIVFVKVLIVSGKSYKDRNRALRGLMPVIFAEQIYNQEHFLYKKCQKIY